MHDCELYQPVRLHVHHIAQWIDDGHSDPENLTTVCWYHHHIVIHGHGSHIDPHSPPQRHQLLQPPIHGPPRLEHAQTKGTIISDKPRFSVSTTPWERRGPTTRPAADGALEPAPPDERGVRAD